MWIWKKGKLHCWPLALVPCQVSFCLSEHWSGMNKELRSSFALSHFVYDGSAHVSWLKFNLQAPSCVEFSLREARNQEGGSRGILATSQFFIVRKAYSKDSCVGTVLSSGAVPVIDYELDNKVWFKWFILGFFQRQSPALGGTVSDKLVSNKTIMDTKINIFSFLYS